MPNVFVTNTYLSDIASAIRAKNGLSTLYKPTEMDAAINALNLSGSITADMIAQQTISGVVSGSVSFIGSCAFYGNSSLTEATFPNCTSIGASAFYSCGSLTTVSFPNCASISVAAFSLCTSLEVADFPNCTSISNYAFNACSSLIAVSFPNCTIIGGYVFYNCNKLTAVDFPSCISISAGTFSFCTTLATISLPRCTFISNSAFRNCYSLLSLYLNSVSTVTTLSGTSAFYSTPIGGYTTSTGGVYGSVFVPSSLYASFLTATNWTAISARIVSV